MHFRKVFPEFFVSKVKQQAGEITDAGVFVVNLIAADIEVHRKYREPFEFGIRIVVPSAKEGKALLVDKLEKLVCPLAIIFVAASLV
jgi:hypothetical protein